MRREYLWVQTAPMFIEQVVGGRGELRMASVADILQCGCSLVQDGLRGWLGDYFFPDARNLPIVISKQ